MRALLINDEARAKVAAVIAHAEKHHYMPQPGSPPPGDDERFVAKLGTYRTVFTFTIAGGVLWRHLSVSVPGKKFPNPVAVFAIADLYGFTGYDASEHYMASPPKGWAINISDDEHCVVVGQPVASTATKAEIN